MNTANAQKFDGFMRRLMSCSRYAKHALNTDSGLLNWLQNNFDTPCDRNDILALLLQSGLNLNDEADLARAVRRLRTFVRGLVRIRDDDQEIQIAVQRGVAPHVGTEEDDAVGM